MDNTTKQGLHAAPAQASKANAGAQAYELVADAYGAYWPEQPMDKARTIMLLEDALKHVTVEVLVAKAKAAAVSHGENRCKLSLLVADGYWRRRYPCESKPSFVIRRHNPGQI